MKKKCLAFKEKTVDKLPVKVKKIKKKKRYLNYFDVRDLQGNQLISRREKKDIWQGLYEFLMMESKSDEKPSLAEISKIFDESGIKIKGKLKIDKIYEYKHQLTHQTIICISKIIRFIFAGE